MFFMCVAPIKQIVAHIYVDRAFDLANFGLHPYRALRARATMRLLHLVVGSLLACLAGLIFKSSGRD